MPQFEERRSNIEAIKFAGTRSSAFQIFKFMQPKDFNSNWCVKYKDGRLNIISRGIEIIVGKDMWLLSMGKDWVTMTDDEFQAKYQPCRK